MTSPPLAPAFMVRAIYSDAETRLIETITRRLARGIDDPGWAGRKLADVLSVRADLERQIVAAMRDAGNITGDAIVNEYTRATAEAVAEIEALGRPVAGVLGQGGNRAAIRALATEASGIISATGPRMLRATMDAYREAVIGPAGSVLSGSATRLNAAQSVLDRLADRGIVGFVDGAGRAWESAAYAEMATRTAVLNASVQGHTSTLTAHGYDLARISTSPTSCPQCDPWEGRIVSLSGKTPRYPTLDEARAQGLHHPNCRHTEGVYIPGLSRAAPPRVAKRGRDDRYEVTQEQRYNERQIRKWKRREAASLDDRSAAQAREHVRGYQARQRELVADNAEIVRRLPVREQIARAH